MRFRQLAVYLCFFGVVVFAIAAVAVARADDEAKDLLAQHKAYVGWSLGDGAIESIEYDGAISRAGRTGQDSQIAKLHTIRVGLAFRTATDYANGGQIEYQGFTGSKFWFSTENGFVVPLVTDQRYDILAENIVFGEGVAQLPATVLRRDGVDGVPVIVVRETPPKGTPLDLYLDPKTGALKRYVIDPDRYPYAVDIDAYTEVLPGKRVISAFHQEGSSRRVRFDDIHANRAGAGADLAPPPPRARWTFAKGVAIPIKVTDDRIYVDATINGVQGRFILDTGAYRISLTDAFADRIHFDRSKAITFGGIAGNKRGSTGAVEAVEFPDGSKLENLFVTSGLELRGEADGLIGFDFFAGAIVDIDFDRSQIRLYDPRIDAPNESSGVVANADLGDGSPVIPVKLNGSLTSHAILDSGSPGDVLMSAAFRDKLRMLVDNTRLSSLAVVGGVSGGAELDYCGTLDSIVVGPTTYQGTRACYSHSLTRDESIIGIHFLKNFNLTLDYPDAKLVLSRRR